VGIVSVVSEIKWFVDWFANDLSSNKLDDFKSICKNY